MKYTKITISGKICTGKTTLFWTLLKKLNWPIFSTSQYFRDYARTHKMILEKATEQNDKLTKEVDFRVRRMLRSKGNLIVEGWMAGIMANSFPDVVRLLLVCDDRIRIKRFAKREKVNLEEAKKLVYDRENNLFGKLGEIYKRSDFVDPKNYNLIIDTSYITPQAVLKKVLTKLL